MSSAIASAGQFDLVVIGAGINGAAVAREAALHGIRTLLV
jgi:glycerol-3-phosphate dehydrogenase